MAMKILVLSQYWYPENGVPQRRWLWLSKILKEDGHDIVVITPPPHYQRKMSFKDWLGTLGRFPTKTPEIGPSGERIFRCAFLPAGSSLTKKILNQLSVAVATMWTAIHLRKQLFGGPPDLVIGTVPALPTAITTPIISALLRTRYALDLRDAWPELLNARSRWNEGTGKRSLREFLARLGPLQILSFALERVMHEVFRRSIGIILTSKDLEEHLRQHPSVGNGKPTMILTTIRNVFPPKADYCPTSNLDGPANELNVLYAGTLGRAQQLSNVILAVKYAEQEGVRINLRLVGAGAARSALKALANEIGVQVDLKPRLPANELFSHYDWADTALVHLADWEELALAIPSKTYELMALGIHISGAIRGEGARIIEELGAGDVVLPNRPEELGHLWAELARDRARLQVGGAGKKWVYRQREYVAPKTLKSFIVRINEAK